MTLPSQTNKKYNSVAKLLKAQGASKEVTDTFNKLKAQTNIARRLTHMRTKAGLTQAQMAKKIGCTPSAISKLESANNDDITLGNIKQYAEVTGETLHLIFKAKTINERKK